MVVSNVPINLSSIIDTKEIVGQVIEKLSGQLAPIVPIAKIAGILVVVYLIILIVKAFFRIRESFNIAAIRKNVEEINQKIGGKKRKQV